MHSTCGIRNIPEDRDQNACSCLEEKRKSCLVTDKYTRGACLCNTHTLALSCVFIEWLKTHAETQHSVWRVIITPEFEVIPRGVVLIDFFMAIRRTLQVLARTGTVAFSSVVASRR